MRRAEALETARFERMIHSVLMDLDSEDMKDFCFYLKNHTSDKHEPIPRCKLEDKSQREVASLLCQHFSTDAPRVTVEVLRQMNKNELASELEELAGLSLSEDRRPKTRQIRNMQDDNMEEDRTKMFEPELLKPLHLQDRHENKLTSAEFLQTNPFCQGSSSAVVLAEMICEKLKVFMTEAVVNKTAIDIAGDMRSNVPAFRENRLNLEKHILKSLADKREFLRYIKYIREPKTYTEIFIREEVENLMQSQYKNKCLSLLQENIDKIKSQIRTALYEASETTKQQNGDIKLWLQKFTESIKGELTFGSIDPQNFSDVSDFSFLKEETEKKLESISADLTNLSVDKLKESRQRPDQLLIDQLCDCCWEKCPFCAAVCTNTVKGHEGDHSTPFHRSASLKGFPLNSREMSLFFCTTQIVSDGYFYCGFPNRLIPYRSYRYAGPPYNTWRIIPDPYQLSYWKWVVCTFQKELEKYYNLQYSGHGEIPKDWRNITFKQAMESIEYLYR